MSDENKLVLVTIHPQELQAFIATTFNLEDNADRDTERLITTSEQNGLRTSVHSDLKFAHDVLKYL